MPHSTYPMAIEKAGKQDCAYSEDLPVVYGMTAPIGEAKISIPGAIGPYVPRCKKTGNAFLAARDVYSEPVLVAID
jgi:hypothetical protein